MSIVSLDTHTASEAPAPASVRPTVSRSRPRRWWLWITVIALAIVAGYVVFPGLTRGQATGATPSPAAARGVPVVAAPARTGDMGVYLTGLGTATALNTVTVRSRVDGQLVNVAFREGQIVAQGDVLAQLDPRPFQVQLTQAEGQAAKDEATLKNTQLDMKRFQDLFARQLIPSQQLDTQQAMINQFEGTLKTDQGQIDSAKLNLVYTRITAPIGGRVGLRLVDPGNIVHATDQTGLVVITQLDPIAVLFTIPEDSLPPVLQHMRGSRLAVDAFDRDMKTKLATGSLLTIDNQIDQTTGTVKLKAVFPNKDHILFPNQFVNARLLVDTIHDAIIVPSAAIQRSPTSTFVYVVKPDQTVETREVAVRLAVGDDTAIFKGVATGEVVVVDGVDKLQPGTKVAVQQPANAGQKTTAP
jgi:multidrug efflux system membrane fusion protein